MSLDVRFSLALDGIVQHLPDAPVPDPRRLEDDKLDGTSVRHRSSAILGVAAISFEKRIDV
ncbi:MAG: hypothetical protein Q7R50_01325 [Dehalococcoidales bacterium]|nr:hypothetical protein [Dehalococcoidales bacterium]